MSGLDTTTRTGGNNIYLKVMNGKLVQNVKEGTEGRCSVVDRQPDVVPAAWAGVHAHLIVRGWEPGNRLSHLVLARCGRFQDF